MSNNQGDVKSQVENKSKGDVTPTHAKPYHEYPEGTVGSIHDESGRALSSFLPPQTTMDAKQLSEAHHTQECTNFNAKIDEPCIWGRPYMCSINEPYTFHDTALTYAVNKSLTNVVAFLLKKGADPFAPNASSERPVSIALRNGDSTMVQLLLDASKDNLMNTLGAETEMRVGDHVAHMRKIKVTIFDSIIASPSFSDGIDVTIVSLAMNNQMAPYREFIAFIHDDVFQSSKLITEASGLPASLSGIVSEYSGNPFERISKLIPALPSYRQAHIEAAFHRIKKEVDKEREIIDNQQKLEAMIKEIAKQLPSVGKLLGQEMSFTPGYQHKTSSSQSEEVEKAKPGERSGVSGKKKPE